MDCQNSTHTNVCIKKCKLALLSVYLDKSGRFLVYSSLELMSVQHQTSKVGLGNISVTVCVSVVFVGHSSCSPSYSQSSFLSSQFYLWPANITIFLFLCSVCPYSKTSLMQPTNAFFLFPDLKEGWILLSTCYPIMHCRPTRDFFFCQ